MRIDVALGYDPGGDGRHGVAAVHLDAAAGASRIEYETLRTVEDAATWLQDRLPRREGSRAAIGIDTLTVWSTGSAGWRPADAWLREKYPSVKNSVAAPNSLFGSMAIGGVGVLVSLREHASLIVSETHPKVLYFALAQRRYAFDADAGAPMTADLRAWTGWTEVAPRDDHQWDALASAWAVHEGVAGRWVRDLHALPTRAGERLVRPAGPSHFFWPATPAATTRDQ